ncbi:peptidoglycan DD-metalloendopeptidase family protein [Ferrimonas senticii]|uniref:peptidoglycan DD-metalloendopeptidase family protein n=1 Tax=Ferrimonas senticii TaxID=394566 RepID=UPI00041460B4|nr:peptidoglycan DD-metalloendopeptidase family protein [Ferrimonas senticii]
MLETLLASTNQLRQLPIRHRIAMMVTLALMVLMMALPSPNSLAAQFTPPLPVKLRLPLTVNLPSLSETDSEQQAPWQQFTVENGDSMALLFKRAGLSPQTLHQLTQLPQAGKALKNIKPKQVLELQIEDGQLLGLRYPQSASDTLVISRSDSGFSEQLEQLTLQTRQHYASATITSNFWNAAVDAGLTANTIMELAALFGWDIDFALDLRAGDHFAVLWQEHYLDGQHVDQGHILAAEFVNQGEVFRAIRHQDGNYYGDQGRAMKKAFLRAPVQFNYISSNFNPRRLHPVTGRVRPHNGADYVAPVGTPIMAAGDGTVVSSSYNQYNGNYVFIKHSNTYVTKYLHLKKRLVNKGQRVKQGQTIGTLGATGRVTGAHLHYEFLVNGVHRNPRTVKLPQSRSLSGQEKQTFLANSKPLLAQIAHRQSILLARQETNPL